MRNRVAWVVAGLCCSVLAGCGSLQARDMLGGAGDATGSRSRPPISPVSVSMAFRAGSFWYTRMISTDRLSRPAGGEFVHHGYYHGRGPEVAFDVRVSVETWVGVDGTTRQRRLVVSQRFASATGRSHWIAYHRPLPNFAGDIDSDSIILGDGMFPASGPSGDPLGPQDLGDGAFSYRQLLSLPTRPATLRARIEQAFGALARRQANSAVDRCGSGGQTGCKPGPPMPAWQRKDDQVSQDMGNIAEMLSWPIPARLRLTLFHAATTLPAISSDVTVNRHARDSLGRPGVAVTASPPHYPGHYEPDPMRLIFDPATGALLAQPGFGAPSVVTSQGSVNTIGELPKNVSQIRAPGSLPKPPIVAITPVIGDPRTVFKIQVTAPSRASASRRAPRLGGGVSGPVYRGCSSGFSTPTPPSPPPFLSFPGTTTSQGRGHFAYVYRLKPPIGTGNTWCAGRYQLQLDTSGLGPPGPSGVGTAIYFQVK